MIDERIFFREATLAICGSLEIEEALWRFLRCIHKYMPADMIFLNLNKMNAGITENIAEADLSGGRITSVNLLISDAGRKEIMALYRASGSKAVVVTDRLKDNSMFTCMSTIIKNPETPLIAISAAPKWHLFNSLIIGNHSGEKYTEEHVRLLSLLNEPIAIALSNYLRYREMVRLKDIILDDNRYLQDQLLQNIDEQIVGAQFGLRQIMQMAAQVAPLKSPVLLLGETGTGKEVIATAIHKLSLRKEGPFIKVNCGAIPESLIDSELFGHEKGAFTGAFSQKRGRFERAQGGTIFLDEIGELPPGAQVRLLRVLQESEIERVGGTETIPLDIRVIAATNRNLETLLDSKKFREDLYFRLNVFPITISPLRERRSDIPILVKHFIIKKSRQMGLAEIPGLATGAMSRLMSYHWPGNVRELQNVVERAIILSNGAPLTFEEPSIHGTYGNLSVSSMNALDIRNINQAVTNTIMQALERTNGRIEGEKGAAKLLNINPSTLRTKMRKLGIAFGKKRLA